MLYSDAKEKLTSYCSKKRGFKLKEEKIRLDTRKKFFTQRVMRHWNRLPKDVIDVLSLQALKTRLDGIVGMVALRLATIPKGREGNRAK